MKSSDAVSRMVFVLWHGEEVKVSCQDQHHRCHWQQPHRPALVLSTRPSLHGCWVFSWGQGAPYWVHTTRHEGAMCMIYACVVFIKATCTETLWLLFISHPNQIQPVSWLQLFLSNANKLLLKVNITNS